MDQASKRQRVEKIDKEVQELHPLLYDMLRKFRGVQYVEYTHGPDEKGADFVIERHDDSIGATSFIGVVAKCDKILQSFAEVERQIDECGHARLIKGGIQSVRLPEVWVVTTKNVSQNAKEKISEKYPSKKIHFFDADWLVKQIDEHAPHFWEEIDGAVGTYLSGLDKRLGVINSQTAIAIIPSTTTVQMEMDVKEVEADRYNHKRRATKARLVNFQDEVRGNKISIIEAPMGAGKSHLARRIAMHFSDIRMFKETTILPAYANFKSYVDSKQDATVFIESLIGMDCSAHLATHQGKAMIILDGVDEAMADQEQCKVKVEELIQAVKARNEWSLVLTSRPWKTIEELASKHSGIKRYQIRPLSLGKILAYLRKVFEKLNLPNRLIDDLAKSGLFKQLPHNPIAASLLANIIKQEKYELPSSLTELYSKTVELMLGRWDERRKISSEKQYKSNERLARLLARHMIDHQLVYMSREEIRQMFQNFLADRQTGASLEETFDYLINRSTLFGELDDNTVFFKHRSFAEYLYAKDAYESRDLVINEKAFDPYWSNTYFFYVGTRSECPDLIDALVATESKDLSHRIFRLQNMGNYMLAGYETPYVHIQKAMDVVIIEAARLYLDLRDGRVAHGLKGMTEMQLLYVVTTLVRNYYGYDFFKKALPLTMLVIDDLNVADEARQYALFFAACSLADVGDTSGFKFMLEHSNVTSLPIQISFALKCEMSETVKTFANSKPVKDFEKKLKKVMTPSNGGRLDQESRIHLLFNEPLSAKNAKATAMLAKDEPKAKKKAT